MQVKTQQRILSTYIILLVIVFIYHAFEITFLKYFTPIFFIAVPFIYQKKINLRFNFRDVLIGLAVSAIILLPFWYFMTLHGKSLTLLPMHMIIFQFVHQLRYSIFQNIRFVITGENFYVHQNVQCLTKKVMIKILQQN